MYVYAIFWLDLNLRVVRVLLLTVGVTVTMVCIMYRLFMYNVIYLVIYQTG